MKANAPEKIYLFENPITETPDDRWLSKRSDENDIEYTRTDAFIEKACVWIDEMIWDYLELKHPNADTYFGVDMERFEEDFKNYMKGE